MWFGNLLFVVVLFRLSCIVFVLLVGVVVFVFGWYMILIDVNYEMICMFGVGYYLWIVVMVGVVVLLWIDGCEW